MNDPLARFLGDIDKYPLEIKQEGIALLRKMINLDFGAVFSHVEVGPVVRTYFYTPEPSAILSKLMSKEEDLALAIKAESLIITRVKGDISVAVPRKDRELIQFDKSLFTLLTSPATREMTLPILMGKTPRGEDLYEDLASQPHLLIAGTTGSGKSIFTSQLICSLALLHSPSDLRFHLVDTKQLDLTLFEGLPHIGTVIQDIHALRAKLTELLDLVRERTQLMSGAFRNVKEYNNSGMGKFPYQVLIIDEFADVIDSDREYISTLKPSVRPQPIDTLVRRLAQISRAAGVHIVLATQRPSVKLLSGDIKTNFPARICFQLPTMQDSRVVLDENGAEKLLGKGDYLYKTVGSSEVKRAHSAYVSANDIANIISQSEMLRMQYVK